jgi:hypothetical protein
MTEKQRKALKPGDKIRFDSASRGGQWGKRKNSIATVVSPSLIQWPGDEGRVVVFPDQIEEEFVLA